MKPKADTRALEEQLLAAKEAELAETEAYYQELANQIKGLRALLGITEEVPALQVVKSVAAKNNPKPKAKAAPKAKAKKAVKAKAKKVAKVKAAAPKAKNGKASSKTVPRIIDAIQIVMGSGEITAAEAYSELRKRHWLPNSDDPIGYIRYTLSANREIFLRVEGNRGHYYLDPSNPNASGKAPKVAEEKAAKAEPKVAKEPEKPAKVAETKSEPKVAKVAEPKVAKVAEPEVEPVAVEAVEPPPVEAPKPKAAKAAAPPPYASDLDTPESIVDEILSQAGAGAGPFAS